MPSKKCTEPVTPSSGFPTDHRRSDCHSESHQPRTLRTRCTHDSMRIAQPGQALRRSCWRNLRTFLFAQVKLRKPARALATLEETNAPGTKPGPRAVGSTEAPRAEVPAVPAPRAGKDSPSRERFRPPSRRTVRFRVVLLGGLRPTGAPCSAQAGLLQKRTCRSRARPKEFRANCERGSRPVPNRGL